MTTQEHLPYEDDLDTGGYVPEAEDTEHDDFGEDERLDSLVQRLELLTDHVLAKQGDNARRVRNPQAHEQYFEMVLAQQALFNLTLVRILHEMAKMRAG